MTGTHLAHYRIDAELGRGGMGIVYRAHDTKLDRTVALKVLPAHALSSDDDRARFQREARAAARLHHAHIASIFEIGEAVPEGAPHGTEPRPFIAMEFVDGESLAARIAGGPMKLDEAVRIATEMAEALGAAHEAGIVHRDVKAGNVMLTTKGTAKVLDFGLAKTAASTQLTRQGSTLGTVAYMSPEQARGEEVDGRTDLWALGVVLYEMIAGRLPFAADYEQAALYGILNEDPEPLTALRSGVPMGLEWIVQKLLAKDANARYQRADDLLVDLRTVDLTGSRLRTTTVSRPAVAAAPSAGQPARSYAWIVAGVAVMAAFAAIAFALMRPAAAEFPAETSVKRVQVPLDGNIPPLGLDITPDGSTVVYSGSDPGGSEVRVLDLATGSVRRIEGATSSTEVTVSPDGQWVLLTGLATVSKASLSGGRAVSLLTTTEGFPQGGWGPNGTILYEDDQSIWALDESSGAKRRLTTRDSLRGEQDHDWPTMLPDGRTLMATIELGGARTMIGFWDFETGERLAVMEPGGYRPRYLPTGHIAYVADDELLVVPFDVDALRATGSPISVASGVNRSIVAISEGGTLVTADEASPAVGGYAYGMNTLLVHSGGNTSRYGLADDRYMSIEIREMPTSAVVDLASVTGQTDIWVADLRSQGTTALTLDGRSYAPRWTADGDSVLYVTERPEAVGEDRFAVMIRPADGSAAPVELTSSRDRIRSVALSNDGKHLALVLAPPSGSILLALERGRPKSDARRLVGGGGQLDNPVFSPDGRFIAYEDDETIYVIRAHDETGRYRVSDGPGVRPKFSADGAMLYYLGDNTVIGVPVQTGESFGRTGPPDILHESEARITDYHVLSGGRGVLTLVQSIDLAAAEESTDGPAAQPRSLKLVVNWFEELRGLGSGR